MTASEERDDLLRPDDPARDPLFGLDEGKPGGSIFARRDLLVVGTVPESDRIVGRDDEIYNVAQQIKYVTHGEKPNHVIIYGEPGTGKSLVSRHVGQRAIASADALETRAGLAYLECNSLNTPTKVARNICHSLNPDDSPISIPKRGIGADEYYEYLWDVLESHYDGIVVILDEIDRLTDENELLHELSRATEKQSTTAHIGIIAITNNIEYGEELSTEVKSSMRAKDFVFTPYSADDLQAILERRRDAFQPGVLEEGVIEEVADICATDNGDARAAVDMLRNAGEIASERGDDRVTLDHIKEAEPKAKADKVVRLIEGTPDSGKIVLYALAKISRGAEDDAMFSTKEIHERYELAARDISVTPASERTVLDRLLDYDYLKVTHSVKSHAGRFGGGTRRMHSLRKSPEVVLDAVLRSDRRLRKLESGSVAFNSK